MKGKMGKVTRRGCLWDSTLEHIVYTYEDGDVFLILGVPQQDRPYFPVLLREKLDGCWIRGGDICENPPQTVVHWIHKEE